MKLQGWQFLVLMFILFILFGSKKLPSFAKSLGESLRILKSEIKKSRLNNDQEKKD